MKPYVKSKLQVIYGTREIFALAQDVSDTLERKEAELMGKVRSTLGNGTAAVDPTLFSPDIILLDDDKGCQMFCSQPLWIKTGPGLREITFGGRWE